jgi:hypothetical protein
LKLLKIASRRRSSISWMLYDGAWRRNVEVARDGSQRHARVIIVLRRKPDVRVRERRKLAERRLAATPRFRAGERTVSQSPTSDASLLAMRTPYFMFSVALADAPVGHDTVHLTAYASPPVLPDSHEY